MFFALRIEWFLNSRGYVPVSLAVFSWRIDFEMGREQLMR